MVTGPNLLIVISYVCPSKSIYKLGDNCELRGVDVGKVGQDAGWVRYDVCECGGAVCVCVFGVGDGWYTGMPKLLDVSAEKCYILH